MLKLLLRKYLASVERLTNTAVAYLTIKNVIVVGLNARKGVGKGFKDAQGVGKGFFR